ncbi:MAG: DUF559 domain-containing protein [Sphingomonas sp.]|uniref:endonuclease domain-containing protein n=1 Tax=Sphingomonas sp. TaxID=28214 RepID=UPI00182723AF|nr:DUF559 domain-containing protein [Sphingomonas sp.]
MRTYDHQPSGTIDRARTLRRDSTDAEKKIWSALREARLAKFRRQMPVGPYFADFACFAERLIVEIDGGQHSPEGDAARTRFLEAQGYRVLRFWNHEVMENVGGVIETIAQQLSPSPSRGIAAHPSPDGRGTP